MALDCCNLPTMSDLHRLGRGQLGVWTRTQAGRLLSDGAIDARVRSGTWQVLWPGVYADAGHEANAEQRAAAATLAVGRPGRGPDSAAPAHPVICGRLAARVWRLPLIDDEDPATGARDLVHEDVAIAEHRRAIRLGDRVLHPAQLVREPGDVVRTTSGLFVTSPLRTLVDCARLLTHEALVCAMDDALHRGLVDPPALAAAVARRHGMAGAPALRAAVVVADGRAESPVETLVGLLLLPLLPELRLQVRLFDQRARLVARFDLGDEAVRLAVETDGRRGHAGRTMVAKDNRRDRTTGAFGWTTERVIWLEARRQQAQLTHRIMTTYSRLQQRRAA